MFIVSKNKNHPFCINYERILYANYFEVKSNSKSIWTLTVILIQDSERGSTETARWSFHKQEDAEDAFNEMMDLIPDAQRKMK